nr:GNAT family protein [Olsenella profusa]
MRSARAEDVDAYWEGFRVLDPEAARLTGSRTDFTYEEVTSFFLRCVDDPDRYDLLLVTPDGSVVGESVINETDWQARSANYRIALFGPGARGRGLGTWVVESTRDLAFGELGLHRLSLDVFSVNPRARHVYEKAGFKVEGVARDAVWLGPEEGYCDDVLMALLEDEWRELV